MDAINKSILLDALSSTFEYRITPFDFDEIVADLENIREDTGFRKRWELYCKRNAYVEAIDFDQLIATLEDKIKSIANC